VLQVEDSAGGPFTGRGLASRDGMRTLRQSGIVGTLNRCCEKRTGDGRITSKEKTERGTSTSVSSAKGSSWKESRVCRRAKGSEKGHRQKEGYSPESIPGKSYERPGESDTV